ncbi:MAG: tyrosine-type recombinase/integrase [Oscillospiraceae bacterium]|nr:tyrosine-type recombinase/integrase [Oscillospiraceae bacterium]
MKDTDFLDSYFLYCRLQKNLDAKTLKAYQIDLRQFEDYLAERNNDPCREVIEKYIELLVTRYKISTVRRKCAAIKAYYHYLMYQEIITENPFSKIEIRLHQENLLPRTIEPHVLELLFDAAYKTLSAAPNQARFFSSLRDVAVLELLFACGVRVSELCHLSCEQVDLVERTVLVMGKGDKERLLYLSSLPVLRVLHDYIILRRKYWPAAAFFFVNRDGNRLTEQSVRLIINKYAALAGQNGHYTPHMFRHSFATYLWDNCGDIYAVKNILGHSCIQTTERYVHAGLQRQKTVLDAFHPRDKLKVSYDMPFEKVSFEAESSPSADALAGSSLTPETPLITRHKTDQP